MRPTFELRADRALSALYPNVYIVAETRKCGKTEKPVYAGGHKNHAPSLP